MSKRKELFTLSGHDSFSIARKKLLTIENADDLILLLDALDELPAFQGNLEELFTVGGLSKLVNALPKSTFKVWNLKTGKVNLMSYRDRVIAIVINNRYRWLLCKSWQYYSVEDTKPEFNLQVWSLSNNVNNNINNLDSGDSPIVITPDGIGLISRSREYTLTIWNLITGKEIFSFPGYIPVIKSLIISSDGDWVIASLADKTVRVCNIKNKQNIFTFAGHNDFVTALVVTPDGKKFISGSLDKTIKIWDLKKGEEIVTIHDKNYASKITVTLDGKWIFSESVCDDFPLFKVWNISTGKEVFTLTCHDENTLKIYNSSNGKIIAHFSIEDELESLILAPDGVTIVAGDELGVVHFFRLEGFIHLIESLPNIQQIIQEKTANFIAREFIFNAINNFLNRYDRGYFTIVGLPGSGKSAIFAKYATENSDVFYYNAEVKGKNRAEEFLKTIKSQLESANGTSLQIILQQISDQLEPNQRFIIAIDSLDAIDYTSQVIGSNLFYLPRYLPKGIYFLLARRPFLKEKSGLLIEAPFQFLNLQDYPEENRQDIQTYIQQYLQELLPSFFASKERFGINQKEFIQQLTDRSENNFMYVSQILTAIKTGFYSEKSSFTDILDSTSLPADLEVYYQHHLQKMFPAEEGKEVNSNAQAVLNSLVQNSSPISVKEISQIIDVDEYDVEEVLENWIEFLTLHQIDGETRYSFYHSSFRNWLIKVKT